MVSDFSDGRLKSEELSFFDPYSEDRYAAPSHPSHRADRYCHRLHRVRRDRADLGVQGVQEERTGSYNKDEFTPGTISLAEKDGKAFFRMSAGAVDSCLRGEIPATVTRTLETM